MSSTLKQIAREMIARDQNLGRQESIASLTTTTAVVNALATGGRSAQEFVDKWMLRRDTATAADRLRRCTTFTSSSGTLAHTGTNYGDTTATSETLEILNYEPYLIDTAINVTLSRLQREDREVLPTHGGSKYWLGDLTWIEKPSDIVRIAYLPNPVLSRNRDFQKWNAYDSSDNLTADWWTLAGASATYARSSTQEWQGNSTAAITRSGTNATFLQPVGLLDTGVDADNLRGETVTIVARVWSAVASQVRGRVTDTASTTNTSYHTGGSGWEELTTTHTVSSTASSLSFGLSVESDNTVCYVGECYLVRGTITDTVRRDDYIDREEEMGTADRFYNQAENALILPKRNLGGQYVIYSARGYPKMQEARILAGTADADSTDAPLIPIATGALGRLYEFLGDDKNAAKWNWKFEELALKHLYQRNPRGDGVFLPRTMMGYPARRG